MSLSGHIKKIDWSVFDATWYAEKYGDVLNFLGIAGTEALEEFYREKGPALRHSPNPYFDEDWYLQRYPAVANAVEKGEWKSGFDHYCQTGFSSHNPHWLFDREFYFKQHPNLQPNVLEEAGFRNFYDHYLNVGDEQFLTGSWFFNPTAYLKSGHARMEGLGAFAQCVSNVQPEQGYVSACLGILILNGTSKPIRMSGRRWIQGAGSRLCTIICVMPHQQITTRMRISRKSFTAA